MAKNLLQILKKFIKNRYLKLVIRSLKNYVLKQFFVKKFHMHKNPSFIIDILGIKQGYFVEIGACDGINSSQCYSLEEFHDWEGIAIEPQKNFIEKKSNKRKKWCHYAVSNRNGIEKFVFLPDQVARSGLKKLNNDDNYMLTKNPKVYSDQIIYEVEVRTLVSILDEYESPKLIDWITIDAEGSEFNIINCFFNENTKYEVKIFTTEINKFTYSNQYLKILKVFLDNGFVEIHDKRTINKLGKEVHDKHFLNTKFLNLLDSY